MSGADVHDGPAPEHPDRTSDRAAELAPQFADVPPVDAERLRADRGATVDISG